MSVSLPFTELSLVGLALDLVDWWDWPSTWLTEHCPSML